MMNMDKIKKIIKRLMFVFLIMYGYNNFVGSVGIFVPINVVTILIVYILGLPALLALILIKFICFY